MPTIGLKEGLKKLEKYCAYQERCHFEVMQKGKSLGLDYYECNELIAALIATNFLNEERFALLYAKSKANQKKWGFVKIEQALKQKKISPYLVRQAIKNIEPATFEKNLILLATKQYALIKNKKATYQHENLLFKYLFSKGYRTDEIKKVLENILS